MGKTIKLKDDVYIANELYSTEERIIGKWIDGKPLYRKTVCTGALLNNTTKTINHKIKKLNKIVNINGYGYNPNSTNTYVLPLPSQETIIVYTDNVNIYIKTTSNRTYITESYITLEYTKTTD